MLDWRAVEQAMQQNLPVFEITLVLVRFDHVASFIVNANHCIMRTAEKIRVFDGIVRLGVPQPPKRQRVGDEIQAAPITAGPDFVKVYRLCR
jgi:hypothetical protein